MKDKFTYIVTEEDAKKELQVMELLRSRFDFSSRLRTKIKKNRGVRINGKPVEGFLRPKAGDVLTISIPEETSYFEPQDVPIRPVYEDQDLLVVDKPAGFVVHPTNGHKDRTIANGVTRYMEQTGQSFKIRFINRLDMDTSGLLALGKNSHAQDGFVKAMNAGLVVKKYVALVLGAFPGDEGTIDAPLGRPDPEKVQRGVVAGGHPAVTHYRVLERFGQRATLLELILETGRTHQIRVHLSHLGCPILGDSLYGGPTDNIKRQALHAAGLSFPHPVTGAPLALEAPLPEDFQNLLDALRHPDQTG